MSVYMDAVLFPNIYREKKIFEQEGWHYELFEKDGELKINGVVYNEMKGAFSSPESVLERYTMNALFPDTCYGNESGGDPDCIPELGYEEFLDFHSKYYHPSNSYIFLYGDMDMEERLSWLDENYLDKFEEKSIDSAIGVEMPFSEPKDLKIYYPIGENESEEKKTYLSKNFVVEDDLDPRLYIAFQILEYVLIDAPGAPLKEALQKAGIGEDIFGGYTNGINQPYFSVIAKNADEERKEDFLRIVTEVLGEQAEGALDRKAVLSGLNFYEFKYREADYGRTPKGLMYGLMALDSWLYGGSPFTHLFYDETFKYLKKAVDEGYFEELIRKYLAENSFAAVITVSPKRGLTKENDDRLREKLAKLKSGLSDSELEELIKRTKELKAYQDAEDSEDDLKKLPVLKIEDIDRRAGSVPLEETEDAEGTPVVFTDINTNGIAYMRAMFDITSFSERELMFAGFLRSVLSCMNTEKHSYSDLSSEILLNSGGLDFDLTAYPLHGEDDRARILFSAEIRVLYEKLDFGFDIISEILGTTCYDDSKRMSDILSEARSRARMRIEGGSHSAAVNRAGSYFSAIARVGELTDGIAYYEFLDESAKLFAEGREDEFISELKSVAEKVFSKGRLILTLCSGREILDEFKKKSEGFRLALKGDETDSGAFSVKPIGKLDEGLKTASQVNYDALCGNFRKKGLPYTGSLQVLRILLNYEYLWLNLRVKGGAYGCMSGFARTGRGYLVSYRDPNVKETYEVYRGLADYLRNTDISEDRLVKYIIGAISDLDAPLTPSVKAARSISKYFSKISDETLQRERDEVLDTKPETIKGLAAYIDALTEENAVCAIGNAEKIDGYSEGFKLIRDLF